MPGSGESKTSPRRIRSVARQKQALEERLQGKTFEEIARTLGYSCSSSAYRAVQAMIAKVPEPAVKEYRLINTWRLNMMRVGNWDAAVSGDAKSIDTEIKIQQEEAKLLGLYAPTKTEYLGDQSAPIQLRVVYDDDNSTGDHIQDSTP